MTALKYFALRQQPQGNTQPLHQPSPSEIRRATGSTSVDYHVEQSTAKE